MNNKIKKLMNRSGKKRCDICNERHILEDHHILGRSVPNYNHPNNRTDICANCHSDVHHGKVVIEGWYTSSNGRILLWHKSEDESFSGRDAMPHIIGS